VGLERFATMTASITTNAGQTSAFTEGGRLVMTCNRPFVNWALDPKKLEEWLTTLEEISHLIPAQHLWSMERLRATLISAHAWHKKEHEEIATTAPTADDLMNYLAAYAFAMGRISGDQS